MPKDLRAYIQQIKTILPGEFARIDRVVDSKFEATAVLRKLELAGRYPLAFFSHPKTVDGAASDFPLVFNAFSSRKKLCLALDMDVNDCGMALPLALSQRYAKGISPITVSPTDAPVKERVAKGDGCGFHRLPIPVHHEKDGGPYILCGSAITKDPTSGHNNLAMIRMQIKDDKTAVIHAEPYHHTGMILKKYGGMGKKAPLVVVIGHHPGFYLGSQWEGKIGTKEYEMCGSALGEPLRLVPSETWGEDFMVPADAEIVLECEADWNDKQEEGPVCEFTRHSRNIMGDLVTKNMDPSVRLLAMTSRGDAYYQSLFIGHAEHVLIGSIPKEAVLYRRIRESHPGIRQVHLTPAGCGRYMCYLSIEQSAPGEAREAILAAFACDRYLKYVFAVDDDVDVFLDEEVLWAMATRTRPDTCTFTIPNTMGTSVDPMVDPDDKRSAKMGIDATRPFGVPFPEVCEAPRGLLDAIRLEDYISEGE